MNVLEMCVNSPYKGSINAGNNDIILSIILDPVELEESHYYPRRVPVKSSSLLYDGSDRKLMSHDRKDETTWDSGPPCCRRCCNSTYLSSTLVENSILIF